MSASDQSLYASVVIPVYNKDSFLQNCFESLDSQTLNHKQFEAVFVDDGSHDRSAQILDEYAEKNPWVKVIHQSNGGVCSARNTGIDNSHGKYIFFLDPDDELSENTLEDVCRFFDSCYEEVDLVTYMIKPYKFGVEGALHFRFRYLTRSGVYDLNDADYSNICQTTMNICVKNLHENNFRFNYVSTNGIVYHEDQQYITEILLKKLKIGYCSTATYKWNKNEESSTINVLKPYFIYDNTMLMYETLFSQCGETIPRYLQSLLIHDIGWKMKSSAALPNHLTGKAYDDALSRLGNLLSKVDDNLIFSHPNIYIYHAFFLANLKKSHKPKTYLGPGGFSVISENGRVLSSGRKIEVQITRTRASRNTLYIRGFIKSPVFMFSEHKSDIKLIAKYSNLSNGIVKSDFLELSNTGADYIYSKDKTGDFRAFRYELPINDPCSLQFLISYQDFSILTYLTFIRPKTNFSTTILNKFIFSGKMITTQPNNGSINVENCDATTESNYRKDLNKTLDKKVLLVRKAVELLNKQLHSKYDQVWIYTDASGRIDNGWYQFEHDATVDDNIMRYYVSNNVNLPEFNNTSKSKVIAYGSPAHKILHWVADKRLFSDVSLVCISPWDNNARSFYADFDHAERIYLQHGVLWSHMPWYYSYDKVFTDKEVVSTHFEIENLTKNYMFKSDELIPCGMPRYDFIEHNQSTRKRILVCPSWRSYLVGDLTPEGRASKTDEFLQSNYYKNLWSLLTDNRLINLLKEYGYELDLKLHPNFSCYGELFSDLHSPINYVDSVENESEYAIIITDYSSYCFDFVYLNRSIIYYIPDEVEFRSGYNNYNTLDMDIDNAMGEHAITPSDVIDAIHRALKNDGKPCEPYSQRESDFFLFYDNNQRERLYKALIND